MTYVTYNEYKDSGISWIDSIPVSWQVLKSKHIFGRINNQSTTGNEELLSVSEYYGVKPKKETINEGEFLSRSESLVGYKKCSKNDLVMNIMLAWKKGLGVTNYDGIVSPAYEIFNINLKLAYPRFMNYLLRTDLYASEFKKQSYGVIDSRLRLYPDNFKEIYCILPPLNEQKQIANYLDNKIAKIDKTIEKNEKLIELLEEKRVALINQVVTKGLNPNVEMKDFGIEWIGEIPEHWEIEKLKSISQAKPSNVDKKSKDDEPPVLLCNYTDVYNNEFITMNLDFMKATASYDQIKKLSLDVDDIIITKDSESADDIAVPAIVSEKLNNVVCGYHLAVIRPNTSIIYPKFLFRSLESDKINKQFEYGANGVTRFGLGTYPINNAYICMPPLNEQKQIANYLDKEISIIIKAIDKIKEHARLLEEYKESLIYNVVTGKVDVRGEDI